MTKLEAYHILAKMWNDATPEQDEAINIAMDCIEFVDLIPKDMVAVVRCKDCKDAGDRIGDDSVLCLSAGCVMGLDGFCSYGERKGG